MSKCECTGWNHGFTVTLAVICLVLAAIPLVVAAALVWWLVEKVYRKV